MVVALSIAVFVGLMVESSKAAMIEAGELVEQDAATPETTPDDNELTLSEMALVDFLGLAEVTAGFPTKMYS